MLHVLVATGNQRKHRINQPQAQCGQINNPCARRAGCGICARADTGSWRAFLRHPTKHSQNLFVMRLPKAGLAVDLGCVEPTIGRKPLVRSIVLPASIPSSSLSRWTPHIASSAPADASAPLMGLPCVVDVGFEGSIRIGLASLLLWLRNISDMLVDSFSPLEAVLARCNSGRFIDALIGEPRAK